MVDLEPDFNVSSYFRPSPPSLRIGAEVCCGIFAVVHKGKLDSQPVAVKKLYRHKEDGYGGKARDFIDSFERECRLLEGLKHSHIVGFLGAFYDIKSKGPMLVMEMLKENLRDSVNREGKLSLPRQLKFCLGLASGVEYLHSRSPPIAHRDLTDKNVMLSEESVVKIVDFGVAKLIENESESMEYYYGYNYYVAPEFYHSTSYSQWTLKVDIFSLGVWMLGISTGHCPPGYMPDNSELPQRYAEAMSSLDDGHLLKPFILQCMKEDYKERPSAVAVHSFIESQVAALIRQGMTEEDRSALLESHYEDALKKLEEVSTVDDLSTANNPTPVPPSTKIRSRGVDEGLETSQMKWAKKAVANKTQPLLPPVEHTKDTEITMDPPSSPPTLDSQPGDIVEKYKDQFLSHVDARAIARKLEIKNVIPNRVSHKIENSAPEDASDILFLHLRSHSSPETLHKLCDVMISMSGYPNMNKLGRAMKEDLPSL